MLMVRPQMQFYKDPEASGCFSSPSLIKKKSHRLNIKIWILWRHFYIEVKYYRLYMKVSKAWTWSSTRNERVYSGGIEVYDEATEKSFQDWYPRPFSEVQVL